MSKTFEIISKYTAGEITLEQANEELKKMKAGGVLTYCIQQRVRGNHW